LLATHVFRGLAANCLLCFAYRGAIQGRPSEARKQSPCLALG
jgi:hypothetical protein